MATFLHHEPCPSCGSRDNLARYSDGSAFCFGCKYYERRTSPEFVHGFSRMDAGADEQELSIPEGTTYAEHVIQWLSRYGLTVEESMQRGLRYDSYWDQLIFPFYDRTGRLVCTQGRNFNHDRAAKAKYYNRGNAQEATQVYKAKEQVSLSSGLTYFPRRLVITEDALSAIRIARQCDAIPALGTSVSIERIVALATSYEFVTVWLDSDKWREARHIAENFQWLGLSANTVFTELDPKEYTDAEIQQFLQK